jgi:multidrug efflux pump subunit AcrA (membrane-fusion protein)
MISAGKGRTENDEMNLPAFMSKNRLLLAGGIFLVLLVWFGAGSFFNTESEAGKGIPVQVEARSFRLSVMERGVVIPARVSPVSSKISSNQAKIVWLIREGIRVEKGTLIARFDTKPFLDKLHKAEQLFADAEATLHASEKLLSLQKEEENGKIEEAFRKLEIAKIQANNIENGSGPLKRKIFEQKLHQSERVLALDRNELADLEVLLKKGHISVRERDRSAEKVKTAVEQVQVARAELENFNRYTWPKLLREAELLVKGAESNLQRVKRTADLQIQNWTAKVEKARRALENRRKILGKAQMDVVYCNIFSPTGGLLLYAELPRENGRRKIQIGDSVWEGQTFLQVPDTRDLVAEIWVREIDVAKIKNGMDAEIELDAFPGKIFTGRVESIASLAKEDKKHRGVRRFYTRIRFTQDVGQVHVGMSVTTKIIYRLVENVPAVPPDSIIYRGGRTFVNKLVGKETELVPVTLGARGKEWIEVVDGLYAGDRIVRQGL